MIVGTGDVSVNRLEESVDAVDLSILRLPVPDLSFRETQSRCFKTFIRTNNGQLNLGLIYFPDAVEDDVIPAGHFQSTLYIVGYVQMGSNGWPPYRFMIVVTSYRRYSVAVQVEGNENIGRLNLAILGFNRRIVDVDQLYPPIFEFYWQNKCIYSNVTDVLRTSFHNGPILDILNTVDEADDFLIPCLLLGTFEDISVYRAIEIEPIDAVQQFVDMPELDISIETSIPAMILIRAFMMLASRSGAFGL